jgi:hypothetical protein
MLPSATREEVAEKEKVNFLFSSVLLFLSNYNLLKQHVVFP